MSKRRTFKITPVVFYNLQSHCPNIYLHRPTDLFICPIVDCWSERGKSRRGEGPLGDPTSYMSNPKTISGYIRLLETPNANFKVYFQPFFRSPNLSPRPSSPSRQTPNTGAPCTACRASPPDNSSPPPQSVAAPRGAECRSPALQTPVSTSEDAGETFLLRGPGGGVSGCLPALRHQGRQHDSGSL